MTGTGCELLFLRFVLANATDLQSVTVSFNLYFIEEEEEDSRMCYFLHTLLGDGTWTACEDEGFDKPYKCSGRHLHELRDGCVIAECMHLLLNIIYAS
jgi:hypothetical protein